MTQTELRFNGPDYVPERDNARLGAQFLDVLGCLKDGLWHTLLEIEQRTGHPQASISAQIRHARKLRFGKHEVVKRYIADGLFEYRMVR